MNRASGSAALPRLASPCSAISWSPLGFLATIPLVLVVILLVAFRPDPGSMVGEQGVQLLLLRLFAVACLFVGLRITRGRRRLILFLRRFGFAGSSQALTFAVGTALGRRWRLVTLDDAEIAPVGVSTRARRLWGVGHWIMLVLFVAGLVYAWPWLFGDAVGTTVGEIFDDVYYAAVARGDNPFVAIFGAFIATLLVGMVVLGLVVVVIFIPIATAGTASIFSWGSWRAIRRAEQSKVRDVRTERDILRIVDRVVKRASAIFAPRLAVLRTAHNTWRQEAASREVPRNPRRHQCRSRLAKYVNPPLWGLVASDCSVRQYWSCPECCRDASQWFPF